MNETFSLLIMGRQPALGIAELERLYGVQNIQPLPQAAVVTLPPEKIDFKRLGGSVKLAKILTIFDHTDVKKQINYLADTLPKHLDYIPEGKFTFGVSLYDLPYRLDALNREVLRIKKAVKATGRSVRIVPNKALQLNSAQVIHNGLTKPTGMELILIKSGPNTLLAQTVAEQDIEAYAARDQERPMRDARVGMLPPKLAQIIINLAKPEPTSTVLDPFCGTGVVLQESLLMGFPAYGTDLEPRMVEYSFKNLEWLRSKTSLAELTSRVETGDATNYTWQLPFDAIACETYLGRPFSSLPDPKTLEQVRQDVDLIHKKFLQNVAKQTKPGFCLCIAVPAWKTPRGFLHLKTLDRLTDLGYNLVRFEHVRADELIYHRQGQIVARELVVLQRI